MGHGTRSRFLSTFKSKMASLAIRQFEFRSYFHLFSVTLDARHKLESVKTLFSGINCLKEVEIYLLVRSISLDGEIELEG